MNKLDLFNAEVKLVNLKIVCILLLLLKHFKLVCEDKGFELFPLWTLTMDKNVKILKQKLSSKVFSLFL